MGILVGVGTLVLAAVTAWLAWSAWAQVKTSRLQIERSHRPVIVPASNTGEIRFQRGTIGPVPLPTNWEGHLAVPVTNVGMGPALNVRGEVELGGGGSIHGRGFVEHPVAGIAAGDSNAVVFARRSDRENMSLQIGFRARLAYDDVAGKTYYTDLEYNDATKGYRSTAHPPVEAEPTSPLISHRATARSNALDGSGRSNAARV